MSSVRARVFHFVNTVLTTVQIPFLRRRKMSNMSFPKSEIIMPIFEIKCVILYHYNEKSDERNEIKEKHPPLFGP